MSLPSISSPGVMLRRATRAEQVYIWTRHQPYWGPQYTVQSYIAKEERLLESKLASSNGLVAWILTDAATPPNGKRRILSAAETYRKRAVVRDPDGHVRDVTAYGIARVYTFDEFRSQGYASGMLTLLGATMDEWQQNSPGSAEFSVLFSDVGKKFYSKVEWMPFPSSHFTFPVKAPAAKLDAAGLTLITKANLQEFAELEEQTARRKIASPLTKSQRTRVALLPDLATYEWHIAREELMCNRVSGRASAVHGAIYTPVGRPNSRVWMFWSCHLQENRNADNNVMNILHCALEDDFISDEELTKAISAILEAANTQAHEYSCSRIDMWTPGERVQNIIENLVDFQAKVVHREKTRVASLRWFGNGPISEVDWVDNEKFGWC